MAIAKANRGQELTARRYDVVRLQQLLEEYADNPIAVQVFTTMLKITNERVQLLTKEGV